MKKFSLFSLFLCLLHTNVLFGQTQFIGNPPDWNWIQTIGGNSGADHGQSIVGDAQGNFFIGGDFSGATQFGATSLTTEGQINGFIAKCDQVGAVLWTKQFKSSSTDGKVYVASITIDPDGNLVVLGHFRGGDLKLGSQTYYLSGTSNIFLAKFGPNGALIWLNTYGSGLSYGKILADGDGSIFALGNDKLRKFSSTGILIWEQFNPSYPFSDFDIKGNNLYLTGQFYYEVQLGNEILNTPGNAIFLTKVDKTDGSFSNASIIASDPFNNFASRLYLSSISMVNETDFLLAGSFRLEVSIGSYNLIDSSTNQCFLAKFESGNCAWAIQSKSANPSYYATPAQVLTTATGDAYLFGNKFGSTAFGNNTLGASESGFLAKIEGSTGNIISLSGQPTFTKGWTDGQNLLQIGASFYNINYRKTNAAGSVLFNLNLDSDSGNGYVSGVKTDPTGTYSMANVTAKTYFLGQASYNPTPSIVINKINHAGNMPLWQQTIAGATSLSNFGHALWLDKSHEKLYMVGLFSNVFYYGGQLVDTSGNKGEFVAQMGTDGSYGWIKTFPKTAYINSVITDAAGNIFINGTFSGELKLGNIFLQSAGNDDIFWAKLSASGQYLMAQRMGGEDTDYESYAGVDAQGNLYMCGIYNSYNIDFNATNQTTRVDGDGLNYFVKFAPDGQISWIKNFGNTDEPGMEYDCAATSVEVDADGNSYIAAYHGKSNFWGSYHLTSPYFTNNLVAKIDPNGAPIWVKSIPTKRSGISFCEIGIDELGDCYTASRFRDSVYFDGALITKVGSLAQNAYVAKMSGVDGAIIWVKTISGSEEASVAPYTISVYDDQSFYLGGSIIDRLNFDAQSINTNNGRKGFLALIGQTIVVGTEQPSADAFFITVSPNPTAEQVTVSNASEQVNNLLLEIFDASGELVAKQTLSNFTGKTSFDLSTSPAGVYFLKASTQDGQQILRVVKN